MNQSQDNDSVNDIASRRSVMRSVTAYTVRPIAVFCILISAAPLRHPATPLWHPKKGGRKPHTTHTDQLQIEQARKGIWGGRDKGSAWQKMPSRWRTNT